MSEERETAKRLILKIIQASGGELKGKTILFKRYYYAHLEHWTRTQEMLTTRTIARMDNGPGIDGHYGILREMEESGVIDITHEPTGLERPTEVYRLKVSVKLNENEPEDSAVLAAYEKTKNMYGKALSDKTHRDSITWNKASNGDLIDVFIDAATPEELARVRQSQEKISRLLNEALGNG